MRKLLAIVPAALAILAMSVVPVSAKSKDATPPPDVQKGTNEHTTYVDDEFCHFGPYNFDITVDGYDTYKITTYYNADSSISKIVFEDTFKGTVTGPTGVMLQKMAAGHTVYDYNGGTDTFDGLEAKYSPIDGGKPIAADRGKIVFDENGIVSEKGQHPIADGPGTLAVCQILSGA